MVAMTVLSSVTYAVRLAWPLWAHSTALASGPSSSSSARTFSAMATSRDTDAVASDRASCRRAL